VDIKHLRLAGVYPYLAEKGHEARAECVELLARVPDLAYSDVPLLEEAHVVLQPVGGKSPAPSSRRIVSSYCSVVLTDVGAKRTRTLMAMLRVLGVAPTLPRIRKRAD